MEILIPEINELDKPILGIAIIKSKIIPKQHWVDLKSPASFLITLSQVNTSINQIWNSRHNYLRVTSLKMEKYSGLVRNYKLVN